ncbi:hypothetical protein [Corynebacterium xerosis]|uniref:hypothetical protein n=1 Tax=Corynebacterium xerosis TaxID=1725 RepID=UPI0011BF4A26|nr:hypothetical protein [Corynebacterium xerosis]
MAKAGVLKDATDIAVDYSRSERDFATDGPFVVTGLITVEGVMPGGVLNIEAIANELRARY